MITIRDIYKKFDTRHVLNGLSLSLKEGETKAIIGRSGVGKSVLLKSIVGLLKPDAGSIKVNGQEVVGLSEKEYNELRMDIGLVFQGGALFDSLNVGENVAFVLNEFMKFDTKAKRDKVRDALALVGLKDIENMMPAELSGGMRKRVGLARVLCMEPKIILYDEPTSEVDPITADTINDLIIDMRDKLKVTSLVVTHDMNAAYRVADSIAMFYHGQVIADGTVDQIKNSKHPVVQQFINGCGTGPITDDESMVFGHAR